MFSIFLCKKIQVCNLVNYAAAAQARRGRRHNSQRVSVMLARVCCNDTPPNSIPSP